MARKPLKKFADGGAAQSRYARKVADIQSDYAKQAKSGNASVAAAKRDQRLADAKDDLAKWTGADRTQTRAGESAAEAALSEARRTRGVSYARSQAISNASSDKPAVTKAVSAGDLSKPTEPKTFAEAFRAARKDKGAGETFTWRGKSFTTDYASNKSAAPAARQKPSAPTATQKPNTSTTKQGPAAPAVKQADNPAVTAAPTQQRRSFGQSSAGAAAFEAGQRVLEAQAAADAARAAKDAAADAARAAKDAADRKAKMMALMQNQSAMSIPTAPASLPMGRQPMAATGYKKGGKVKAAPVKKFAKGGSIDGCAIRGKTRAKRTK
jgi:hypothetical protein